MAPSERERFEVEMLPHLDAAYTLARYLMRNDYEADDVVQDAFLRALKYFSGFRGVGAGASRAWLLAIVRNTALTWQRRLHRVDVETTEFDETLHSEAVADRDPQADLVRDSSRTTVAEALQQLPTEFREVIVLRELEGLSYKEISAVTGVPTGTVMSRLSRARNRLALVLADAGTERV